MRQKRTLSARDERLLNGPAADVHMRNCTREQPQWNTFKRALFGIFPHCGGSS